MVGVHNMSNSFILLKKQLILEKFWKKKYFVILCTFSTSDNKKKWNLWGAFKTDFRDAVVYLASRFYFSQYIRYSASSYFFLS